ncbi:MAG: MotA/TolQ/ExbB proton channel family protein [bacterium]
MNLFGTSAWQLVWQSDFMTKMILLLLFSLSVLCLAIIAYKYVSIKFQRNRVKKLLSKLRGVKTFAGLIEISKEFKDCIGGDFLMQNLNELHELLKDAEDNKKNSHLTLEQMEFLELSVDQSVDQLLIEEEKYLPVLGTSAVVSPLIGLFGTVWGLIHAFINISQEKSADISVVAPGIAEALTTTLAGLIVAIPAMVAFHYFSNELRKLEQQLGNISGRFYNIVKQTFVG